MMGSPGPSSSFDPLHSLPPEITYQIVEHLYYLLPLNRLWRVQAICRLFRDTLAAVLADHRFPKEYYIEELPGSGSADETLTDADGDGHSVSTATTTSLTYARMQPHRIVENKTSVTLGSLVLGFTKTVQIPVRKVKIEHNGNDIARVHRVFYMLDLPLSPQHADLLLQQVKFKDTYVGQIFGTSSWPTNCVSRTPLWDEPITSVNVNTVVLELSRLVGRSPGTVQLVVRKRPVENTVVVEDLMIRLVNWAEGLTDGDAEIISRPENRMFRGLRWIGENVFEVETRSNMFFV